MFGGFDFSFRSCLGFRVLLFGFVLGLILVFVYCLWFIWFWLGDLWLVWFALLVVLAVVLWLLRSFCFFVWVCILGFAMLDLRLVFDVLVVFRL